MTLEPVPEDWDRCLSIVAHPDDLEYGGSSALARWTDQGKTAVELLATRGEAGIATMDPEETARVRTRGAGGRARAIVGVDGGRVPRWPPRRDAGATASTSGATSPAPSAGTAPTSC